MRYKMWLEVETQLLFFFLAVLRTRFFCCLVFKLKMDFKKQYCSHSVLLPEMDIVVVCSNIWELEKRGGLWCENVETRRAGFVRLLCLQSSISSHALFEKPRVKIYRWHSRVTTASLPPSLLLYFSPSPMILCTSFNCMCLFELLYI